MFKKILAIDPGKNKSGIAVLERNSGIVFKGIFNFSSLKEELKKIIEAYRPEAVILGGGTYSKKNKQVIQEISNLNLIIIDEKYTTQLAKFKYFKDHPPRGFWKIIPLSLQVPKEPYDDYAAIIIAEKYFKEFE